MNNIEVSSQYYKICELEAEMKRGREQYAKAIPQYEALLDIVEKSKRAKELPGRKAEKDALLVLTDLFWYLDFYCFHLP